MIFACLLLCTPALDSWLRASAGEVCFCNDINNRNPRGVLPSRPRVTSVVHSQFIVFFSIVTPQTESVIAGSGERTYSRLLAALLFLSACIRVFVTLSLYVCMHRMSVYECAGWRGVEGGRDISASPREGIQTRDCGLCTLRSLNWTCNTYTRTNLSSF